MSGVAEAKAPQAEHLLSGPAIKGSFALSLAMQAPGKGEGQIELDRSCCRCSQEAKLKPPVTHALPTGLDARGAPAAMH